MDDPTAEAIAGIEATAPIDRVRGAGSDRYSISSAGNLLQIVLALGEFDALTLQQAAETAGVSRSTAYRLLRTLESVGFVDRIQGGGGYRLGAAALDWARRIERLQGVHGVTAPVQKELHDITGDLAGIVLVSATGLTWVSGIGGPPDQPRDVLFESHADRAVPLHASGSGRAIAAHLPPDQLGLLLGAEPYRAYTPDTPTTWRQLQRLLDEVRTTGYAADRGQVSIETGGVAAPFFAGEHVVGAISLAGPRSQFQEDYIRQVAAPVMRAADKITSRLTPLRDRVAPDHLRP